MRECGRKNARMREWGNGRGEVRECENAGVERENISCSRQWQLAVESGEVLKCNWKLKTGTGMAVQPPPCASAPLREKKKF